MQFLSYLFLITTLISCTNESAQLTSSSSATRSYSGLLTNLTENAGFKAVLTGEQKGTGKDGLVHVTVEFSSVVDEFTEEHIKTTNAHITGFKQVGSGKYEFFLEPIVPEEVTVYIPEGQISHGIFNFTNIESNTLSFTFNDADYDELNINGLQPVLTSNKNDGVMNVVATFNAKVKDFTESNLTIENGAITKLNKTSDTTWEIEITALDEGEVTAFIPAGVVKSKFYGFKNKESNTVRATFKDFEIDQTIKVDLVSIGKKESYTPAKLVLIIDDSSSMAAIQAKVANALKNSLSKLKGKNVRVYAYSTTGIRADHGNFGKTYNAQMPYGLNVFSNYVGSLPATSPGFKTFGQYLSYYINSAGTSNNGSISPFLYKEVFVEKNNVETKFTDGMFFDHNLTTERYTINKSAFDSDDGSVFLNANLSESEFNDSIDRIYNKINAFGIKGLTQEMPLCTLMTLLKNEGPHAIFNNKEKTTFLVITDENHFDRPCLSGQQSSNVKNEGMAVYALNKYRRLLFKSNYICDAGSDTLCSRISSLRLDDEADCFVNGVDRCTDELDNTACNAAEIKLIRDKFSSSTSTIIPDTDAELNCRVDVLNASLAYPGSFGSKGITIRTNQNILGDIKDNCDNIKNYEVYTFADPTDAKSPRVWKLETSKSLLNYIIDHNSLQYQDSGTELSFNGLCSYRPYNHTQTLLGDDAGPAYKPTGVPDGRKDGFTYINGITKLEDLKESISDTAKSLFGESNYTIVGIANLGESNPDGCPNTVASESKDIIDIADTSISICEDNYDSALAWFDQFLKFVPEPIYDLKNSELNLQDNVESILGVKLDYQDNSLDKSQYEFKDGVLTFKDPNILRFIGGEKFEIKYRNVK